MDTCWVKCIFNLVKIMTGQNLKEISVNEILGQKESGEKYGTRSFILSLIRQNPEGVTVNMISDSVDISKDRARVILEDLCKQRELYSRKVPGIQAKLYYPNGKLIHKYLQKSKDIGSQTFRLSFHEGKRTHRMQIQERKYTLLDGEKVEGSIFIDLDNIEPVIMFLEEMLVNYNQYDIKNKKGKELR